MNRIYKITNQINGKVYIGLTTQGIKRRWSEHLYRFNSCEREHALYLAMRKYGIENFDIESIQKTDDPNELPELEMKHIQENDSLNNGYNMTCGGDFISDETREKLRKIFTGRNITWGKKIVATKRERFKEWPCGKVSGSDSKMAKHYLVKHPCGKTEVFKGLRGFSREHNLSHNLLLATLNKKQNHHKGYVLLETFNDYHENEYTQAGGNGGCSVALAGQ